MSPTDRLDQLKQLLEQEPEDAFTRYALALEHISRKMIPQGIELLQETVQRDPSYVPAYHMLGQQFALEGRMDEAREIYQRGIDAARTTGDMHAASEMQTELDELG